MLLKGQISIIRSDIFLEFRKYVGKPQRTTLESAWTIRLDVDLIPPYVDPLLWGSRDL